MSFPLLTDLDTNSQGFVDELTVGTLRYNQLDPPIVAPTTAFLCVRYNTDFTINANTSTLIPFDTTDIIQNITKNSNTRYTVNGNGVYRIAFFGTIETSANNPLVGFNIYKNGNATQIGSQIRVNSSNIEHGNVAFEGILNLNNGDYIEINSYSFTHPCVLNAGGFVGFTTTPACLTIEKLS